MPLYLFQNPEGQTQDLFYSMNEAPKVGTEIEIDGVKWKRLFTMPQAAFGTKPIDPFSKKAFLEKTGAMKGTVGDLWDASKELSERRAEKTGGVDPVKEVYYDQYAKARRGTRSFAEKKEKHNKAIKEANKKLEKHGISIGLS